MRQMLIGSGLVLVVLLGSACAGAAPPTPAAASPAAKPVTAASPAAAGQPVQVAMQGFKFQPEQITVKRGTTVVWENKDSAPHTVTSGTREQPTDRFDSGSVAANGTFRFTFQEPGTIPYFCRFHQGMNGTVVVES